MEAPGHDILTPAVVEILVLGTGEQALPVPKSIRDYISYLGIQLDVMDSVSGLPAFSPARGEGAAIRAGDG
jgi:NADH dehydrogenase [ubiquinone] 1 alpha subcomplex assembly factor 3